MKFRILFLSLGVITSIWFTSVTTAFGQLTEFTYQGRLVANGTAVTGNYDLQFILRPAIGSSNQVGGTLTNLAVPVASGLFTTTLDFGNVFSISPLFLEIGLRTNGSAGPFSILGPQLLTSVPYAVQALAATTYAGNITDTQLSANIPTLSGNPVFTGTVSISNIIANGKVNGTLSGTFSGASSGTFNGAATGTFVGNGGGVTNLNVTNIVGVVQSNPNWQLIQNTSQQAAVANNYLTTNSTLTTLILPTSPNVGSTVRMAGSGANGWVLAQSATQSIMTGPLGLPAGQLWVTPATALGSQAWHATAVSADGLKMIAAYSTGFIFYSNNGGRSWNQGSAASNPWYGLAMSTDGKRMVAVPNGGYIWTSSSGGTNWSQQTGGLTANTFYTCVAASADGVKLVAAANGLNSIYTSTDGGTNWTRRTTGISQNWVSLASSADGIHLFAAPNGSAQIYTSTDSGATWTNRGPTGVTWSAIACSSDGSRVVATANTGFIYTSGDAGITWTPHASSQAWTCVTSSADGKNLAAGYFGYIYTSNDSGLSWQQRTNGINSVLAWNKVSSSGDGSRLLGAVNTGSLYTSTAATTLGTNGMLFGSQYASIELQYIGSGQWMPLSFIGSFTAN